MTQVENYMMEHGFEDLDKEKVRGFLLEVNAASAYLTRKTLMWVDRSGERGEIERNKLLLGRNEQDRPGLRSMKM